MGGLPAIGSHLGVGVTVAERASIHVEVESAGAGRGAHADRQRVGREGLVSRWQTGQLSRNAPCATVATASAGGIESTTAVGVDLAQRYQQQQKEDAKGSHLPVHA